MNIDYTAIFVNDSMKLTEIDSTTLMTAKQAYAGMTHIFCPFVHHFCSICDVHSEVQHTWLSSVSPGTGPGVRNDGIFAAATTARIWASVCTFQPSCSCWSPRHVSFISTTPSGRPLVYHGCRSICTQTHICAFYT